MADFNRGRSGGGYFRKKGFNDRGFGGGRSFNRPTMHKTVCDKCRQECEVPFRPTSGKPVYCNNCFDRPTSRRPEGRGFENRGFHSGNRNPETSRPQYEEQFTLLNSKLDKVLSILMPIVAETEAEEAAEEEIKAPRKSALKKK